jgi:hypothetical protein
MRGGLPAALTVPMLQRASEAFARLIGTGRSVLTGRWRSTVTKSLLKARSKAKTGCHKLPG